MSRLHPSKDLVHLVRRVHVSISSLLGVQYSTSHDLDLQVACCIWSALPGHLHLVTELCLKFLLDLAELGGVPSSTTINNVDLRRHGCRSATAAASQVAGPSGGLLLHCSWKSLKLRQCR